MTCGCSIPATTNVVGVQIPSTTKGPNGIILPRTENYGTIYVPTPILIGGAVLIGVITFLAVKYWQKA